MGTIVTALGLATAIIVVVRVLVGIHRVNDFIEHVEIK